jgi:hypothetical protein
MTDFLPTFSNMDPSIYATSDTSIYSGMDPSVPSSTNSAVLSNTNLTMFSAILPIEFKAQLARQESRGRRVAAYRRYADGDHPANMTREMRELLRVTRNRDVSNEFNDNYMDIIVSSMADRIELRTIEADTNDATNWLSQLLRYNRLAALQGDIHESAIRDGDTYLMVSFDNDDVVPRFTHELAYDGVSGISVFYGSPDISRMLAAVKIWNSIEEIDGRAVIVNRCNVYYPDRVERWRLVNGEVKPHVEEGIDAVQSWTKRDGSPLKVPIIHFRNRGRQNYGMSEIRKAIPLQNVLNRVLYSFVMSSELAGFPIRAAFGFTPPATITPGMWIVVQPEGMMQGDGARIETLKAGDLSQFISSLSFITQEIGRITRTPAPEFSAADNSSGEALKERQIGLLGKVKRFMVHAGNSWETAMQMAWDVAAAFGGSPPPAASSFVSRWADPELRNDDSTVKNALAIRDLVGDRQTLRLVADVFDFNEELIDKILAEKAADSQTKFDAIVSSMPIFGADIDEGESL